MENKRLFDFLGLVKKPIQYSSAEECKKCVEEKVQTNPKFPGFNQTFYTAGDISDFNKYGILQFSTSLPEDINNNSSLEDICFQDIDIESIQNTYEYIYYNFKKGIFVVIKNNKLQVFLPFTNANYFNKYYKTLFFNNYEKTKLETEPYEKISKMLRDKHNKMLRGDVLPDRRKWGLNGCWANYEDYEGELSVAKIYSALKMTLECKKVGDCAFFVNYRDFPIFNKDGSHPFEHFFDKPPQIWDKRKLCPIFTSSRKDSGGEMFFPNSDDLTRLLQAYFPVSCDGIPGYGKFESDWDKKKPMGVFRGAATGCGTCPENNPRLMLAKIAAENPEYINGGVTSLNYKAKKYKGGSFRFIDRKSTPTVDKMDEFEKSTYKYIINIDGSVSAFRLSTELRLNSVLLLVKSDYKLWFSDWLVEYEHYVPVNADLSNIISQIEWCRANDEQCKQIAKNAVVFYEKYLSNEKIIEFIASQLNKISSAMIPGLTSLRLPKFNNNFAFVTCYRNTSDNSRLNQGLKFLEIQQRYYQKIFGEIDVYIINQQQDDTPFNIGKLKNIGFQLATQEKKYDHIIFTDIDMIANLDLLKYLATTPEGIMSLASSGTRYDTVQYSDRDKPSKHRLKPFLGGMISVSSDNFIKFNGYPNNFFGWGGEDDSLIIRTVSELGGIIEIPNGSVIDLEDYVSAKDKLTNLKQNNLKEKNIVEKVFNDIENYKVNGLSTLSFTIVKKQKMLNFYEFIVDISDTSKDPPITLIPDESYQIEVNKIRDQLKKNIYSNVEYNFI